MSEFEEQRDLFTILKAYEAQHPVLSCIFAVPNGTYCSKAQAGKDKASGLRKGVMDICIPCPRDGFSGSWVEMKFGKNKLTEEQKEWRRKMLREGWEVVVFYEAVEAAMYIFGYLGLPDPRLL